MKTEKEIKERIEDIENAMVDCDSRSNYSEGDKLAVKIESLKWVIKE